jgi:hypothetical protein
MQGAEHGSVNSKISRIAFFGNYLPHRCGIATGTTGLCEVTAADSSKQIYFPPSGQVFEWHLFTAL